MIYNYLSRVIQKITLDNAQRNKPLKSIEHIVRYACVVALSQGFEKMISQDCLVGFATGIQHRT